MRDSIKEYEAVQEAAMKFVKSVAEGNSKYARELFTDDAVLFGFLDGELEHGSIEHFTATWIPSAAARHSRHVLMWWQWKKHWRWFVFLKRAGETVSISPTICFC